MWSPPSTVATFPVGPLGVRYVAPDVAVTSTGAVGVSYYVGGADQTVIQRWFAGSFDGGLTFTGRPLGAPFSFDTGTGGTGDGPQGAYQGLAPAGRGFGALFIAGTGEEGDPTDVVFVRIDPAGPQQPSLRVAG